MLNKRNQISPPPLNIQSHLYKTQENANSPPNTESRSVVVWGWKGGVEMRVRKGL